MLVSKGSLGPALALIVHVAFGGICAIRAGEKPPATPAARLDAGAFLRALLEAFERVPAGEDLAGSKEVNDLVTSHTWHAAHQAKAWLEALDPEAPTGGGPGRKETLRRIRALGAIMERERKAPAILRVVGVVEKWGPEEWKAYRKAKAAIKDAEDLGRGGKLAEAGPKIEIAVKGFDALGHTLELSTALSYAAGYHLFRGRFPDGIEAATRNVALEEEIGCEGCLGMRLANLGEVRNRLGDTEEALRLALRALPLFEKRGNRLETAKCRENIGTILSRLGKHEEATGHLLATLSVKEELGFVRDVAKTLTNLGVCRYHVGDMEGSLRFFERALPAVEEMDDFDAWTLFHNLASTRSALGQKEESVACLERGLLHAERTGNGQIIAYSLVALATVRGKAGRHDEEVAYLRRALEIREEIGNRRDLASTWRGIARVEESLGKDAEARDAHQRAIALAEEAGAEDLLVWILGSYGIFLRKLGEHEQAIPILERSAALAEKVGNSADVATARFSAMMSHGKLGRFAEARRQLVLALDSMERARSLFSADRERVIFAETWQGRIAPAMAAALGKDGGADPALAFRAYESLHGIATAELFGLAAQGVSPSSDPALADDERRLSREIDEMERRIQGLEGERPGASLSSARAAEGERARLRAGQRRLEAEWQEAWSRIAREDPAYAVLRRPQPIALEELRRLLPRSTAYLAYAIDETRSYLLAIDREGFHHWALPGEKEIAAAVGSYLEFLRRAPSPGGAETILEAGRKVHGLLLEPAAEVLARNRKLLVAPEGSLYGLPFETLIASGETSGSGGLGGASFVVRTHAITYVHSATAWSIQLGRMRDREEARRKTRAAKPSGILVLADPVGPAERKDQKENVPRPVELAFESVRGAALGRLPHTRREAFAILDALAGNGGLTGADKKAPWRIEVAGRKAAPESFQDALKKARGSGAAVRDIELDGPRARFRLGRPASRDALVGAGGGLEGFRFIHLAAHGLAHPENPGLSGIVLSPGKETSGFLRLMDVLGLKLEADLVTLSACETQLGKTTSGEGYQGLVRAFLYAGAGSVIASSWSVPDRESARLLPGLYSSLLDGRASPGEALRGAQIAYLDSVPKGSPGLASPYYWGAWTAWGAWAE